MRSTLHILRSVIFSVHETVAPACLWLDKEVRFKELESAGWGQTGFAKYVIESTKRNP